MARKDDFKITIQAEFEDNTIGGIKKTQDNLKELGKGIKETKQDVKSLDDAKAEPTLSCRDELTKEVERTQKELNSIDRADVDATVGLNDKASSGIDQLNQKVGDFDKTSATAELGVSDKASSKIESATEAGFDFQNHPFMTSMGIVDKATTVMEEIDGRAKTLAAKAINITIGAIDKATEPLRNVYNWLTSIQGMVTTMVAGKGFESIFAKPVETADFFATSQIGFETMLGSEQAAVDMMKQINDFAIETPFNTSSLVETTQRMIAMGWASEDVIKDLDTIGDAMAAMGKGEEGVGAVTLALSQMRAASKVNAQDMMQLVNVGLPAWNYLAEGMGKSVAEVREMASAGQITADEAIPKILQGMQQFDGMMDRTANETVSGLFSQLEDIAEINIMQPWGKGLSEGVRPALVDVNNILGEVLGNGSTIGDTLQGWGKALGGSVATGIRTFAENVYKVINDPNFNSMTWAEKTTLLLNEGIVKPMSQWWTKSGKKEITTLAKGMMQTLGSGIKELLPVVLQAAFSNPVTGAMVASWGLKTGTNFLGGIMSGLSGAKSAVSNTIGVLKGISNMKNIGGFGNFANTVKEAGSLTEALKRIGEATKATSSGMEGLGNSTELLTDVFGKAYKESGSLTSAMKMAKDTSTALSTGAVTASNATGGLLSSLGGIAPIAAGAAAAVGTVAASYLHYQNIRNSAVSGIQDELNKSDELIEKNKEVNESIAGNIQTRQQDMASLSANEGVAKQFTEMLFSQIEAQNQTAQSQEQIAAYVDNLNQLYPQLGLNYDAATGKLLDQNGALISNKEALEGRIDALNREAMQEAARSQLVEAYKSQIQAETQLKDLEQQRTDLENQRAEALQRLTDSQDNAKNGTDAYSAATREAGIQAAELKKQIDEVNGQINSTNGTLQSSEREIGNLTAIASGSSSQISQTAQETANNVNNSLNSTSANATTAGQQTGANYSGGLSSQEEAVRQSAQQTFSYVTSEANSVNSTMSSKGSEAGFNWMSGFQNAISGVKSWFNNLVSGFNSQIDTVQRRTADYEASHPQKHAQGGILTTPHLGLVAEAGPEAIIPLSGNKKNRGLELWQEAGKYLGVRMYAEGGVPEGSIPSASNESEDSPQTEAVSFNLGIEEQLGNSYAVGAKQSEEFATSVTAINQEAARNTENWWNQLGTSVSSELSSIESEITSSNLNALDSENTFWSELSSLVMSNFNGMAEGVLSQNTDMLNGLTVNNATMLDQYNGLFNGLTTTNAEFQNQYTAFLSYVLAQGIATFAELGNQVGIGYAGVNTTNAGFESTFNAFLNRIYGSGTQTFNQFSSETQTTFSNLITTVSNPLNTIEQSFSSFQQSLVTTGLQAFSDYVNNAKSQLEEAEKAVTNSLKNMVNALESEKSEFYNKGSELMGEIKAGMDSKKSELESGMLSLAEAIKKKFEEGMGIASPSKWGIWAGSMIPEGLIKGMSGDKLSKFVTNMVGDVQNAWDKGHFDANKLVNYLSEDTVVKLMGKLTGLDTSAVNNEQIAYPLAGTRGTITSLYGYRIHPVFGVGRGHAGIDIAAPTGTPILSALAGNVSVAQGGYGGYGNAVVVDSGDLSIVYGHMSAIGTTVGAHVQKGQQIGQVGSTGWSTGPHLHFEMRQGGGTIDPFEYLQGASISAAGGNPLVNAIQNALNIKKGIATVDSATGNVNYNPSAGVAQWTNIVQQALQLTGQPQSYLNDILYAIERESSGNPNDTNNWDSNAAIGQNSRGLMQVIPDTFNAYRDPSLSGNIYDPLANVTAAIRYILARYGSIPAMVNPRRNSKNGWYGYVEGTPSATEGYHWVGERGKELVYFGGGETVFPNSESKKIEDIANGGETNNSSSSQIVFQNGAVTFNITTSGNTTEAMFNSFIQQVEGSAEQIAGIIADKVSDRATGTPFNGVFA